MRQLSFILITRTALVFCLIFFSNWSRGFGDTSQAWLKNSVTFTLSSRLGFQISHETRNLDITYFNPYYKNIAGGFVFHLPQNFYVSAVYKRVHVEIQDIIYNENRFVLEAGWKTKMAEKLDFDIRFRTEIREFDEEYPEDHLRYRLQLRFKTELDIGKLKLEPFIANETLGKSKIYTIQKNRLYIGTMIPMSEHVTFVISYMWLSIKGDESIHILYSGFKLKF
jgi:hypothetical protein